MNTKSITVKFEDEEFERLLAAKGKTRWHDLIMRLAVPGGEEIPHMYWASLGDWEFDLTDSDEDREVYRRVIKTKEEIGALSNRFSTNGFSLVTSDIDEAREVAARAQDIIKEIWHDNLDLADGISISTQPICPKCIEVTRFRDDFCPRCGAQLVESEYISFEESDD